MDFLTGVDYQVFSFFNSWAGVSPAVDWVIIFFAHYVVYLVSAWVVGYFFLHRKELKARQAVVVSAAAVVLSRVFVTEIIRYIAYRDRPYLSHVVVQLIAKGSEPSFPSAHTSGLMALGVAVYFFNKKMGIVISVLTLCVGLSRIFAGVHYPGDILGGAVVGVASALVVYKVFLWKFARVE